LGLQQLENSVVGDFLDLLIAVEDLNFSVFEERRVADHVPEDALIFVVARPTLGTHPTTFITKRGVEFANNKIISGALGGRVAANVHNIRGTEWLGALRISGGETHPPPFSIPGGDVTGGKQQIASDENSGTSPKRGAIVIICTDPNFTNSAMGPHVETFVDVVLKDVFHRIIVIGFEFTEDVCVLGFGSVFWFVLLCDWRFPAGEASWLMTLGDFETMFQTFLDFRRVETALGFARSTRFNFRTGMTVAMMLVVMVNLLVVLVSLAFLILTWPRKISRLRNCSHCKLA
jgi:hypothetical protein